MSRRDWYPLEAGKLVIEINTEALEQLFDKRDPNPYRSKDLDDDVVEYIETSAKEIGRNRLGKVRILTGETFDPEALSIIEKAFKEFFLYRADITSMKIVNELRSGLTSLVIGLCFLSLAIFSSSWIADSLTNKAVEKFLHEFLILLGWVSMWKPINSFLYEWWPLLAWKKLYLTLASIDLEIVSTGILKHEDQLGA